MQGQIIRQDQKQNLSKIASQKKTDQQFYYSLTKYQPVCYSGHGVPFLMKNEGWCNSLACLGCVDVIALAALLLFIINIHRYEQAQPQQKFLSPLLMILISILIILMANASLLLAQFVNPGIRNPSQITQKQFSENEGRVLCQYCCAYVHKRMVHCRECEACIEGHDHHCGYFNKCIGGWQKYFFFATLTFGFLGLITVIMLLAYSVL